MSDKTPVSDQDWTIHALNIHGTFFERWCADTIGSTEGINLDSTGYPVEFQRDKFSPVKESALDVRASYLYQDQDLLTLAIECKKNNPDFVDWIFFLAAKQNQICEFSAIYAAATNQNALGVDVTTGFNQKHYGDISIADDGRETKGNYQSSAQKKQQEDKTKTKTSNAAISDAAYQVALATQAIFTEEKGITLQKHADRQNRFPKIRQQVFLPVILTTANLYTCEFDVKDIAAATGEIPFDRTTLKSHSMIIYDYSLAPHLQIPDLGKNWKPRKQMPILVIHSDYFLEFLKKLKGDEGWRYFKSGF